MTVDRRGFLIGAGALPLVGCGLSLFQERSVGALAQELYRSLKPEQRGKLCLSADHEKRQYVYNDWFVMEELIGDLLGPSQQELALQLFLALHAEGFVPEIKRAVEEDNHAPGVKGLSMAFFGEPDSERGLGLVFAGRHVTRHWEEKSTNPLSGPVFGGHASTTFFEEPDHPGNVWWFQGQAAHRLYESLDVADQEASLSGRKHKDTPKCLEGPREEKGLAFASLDAERLELATQLVHELVVRPFRDEAGERAQQAIEARGGVAELNLHFFRREDWGEDGVYDNFEVWGPGFMCAFRGQYHCHSWLRVDGVG